MDFRLLSLFVSSLAVIVFGNIINKNINVKQFKVCYDAIGVKVFLGILARLSDDRTIFRTIIFTSHKQNTEYGLSSYADISYMLWSICPIYQIKYGRFAHTAHIQHQHRAQYIQYNAMCDAFAHLFFFCI